MPPPRSEPYVLGDVHVMGPDGKLARSSTANSISVEGEYSSKIACVGDTNLGEGSAECALHALDVGANFAGCVGYTEDTDIPLRRDLALLLGDNPVGLRR